MDALKSAVISCATVVLTSGEGNLSRGLRGGGLVGFLTRICACRRRSSPISIYPSFDVCCFDSCFIIPERRDSGNYPLSPNKLFSYQLLRKPEGRRITVPWRIFLHPNARKLVLVLVVQFWHAGINRFE